MKQILLVEDESIIRMDLKLILESENYNVIEGANNGEKAIEYAMKYKPDLILMDIKMPKLDGLKASKIIGKQLDIPIIIITAYSQKEFVEKAQQGNIVGYLVKPIAKANLIPAIEIALHQSKKSKQLQDSIDEAQKEMQHRKVIERAKGIIMQTKSLSEQEAFKYLRDNSMAKQLSMHVVAQKIIDANNQISS